MERTLVICKPDALERSLAAEIMGRLESKGLTLVGADIRTIDAETAGRHYGEHQGSSFYENLVRFITRGPVLLLAVEGPEGTVAMVRTLIGATDPRDAAPGTIRGDLATTMTENLVHGSDSPESATRELDLFFPQLD